MTRTDEWRIFEAPNVNVTARREIADRGTHPCRAEGTSFKRFSEVRATGSHHGSGLQQI
ncbi:hypothetical protein [Arthrobacter sp. MMS24-S77]